MKLKFKKALSILLLCVFMVTTTMIQVSANSNGAVENQTEKVTYGQAETEDMEILGDYYKQYAVTLYNEKLLKSPDDSIAFNVDTESRSLIISGTNDKLLGTKISIDKEFNFDGKPVGRFSIDASAEAGQNVEIGFYLDDSNTPFFTAELVKQQEKDVWTFSKDISKDVMDRNIQGKHRLSFALLSSSENKSTAFSIKSFEFAESSVPVIYLEIDESKGTIADMNSDPKHKTECYGDMTIKVPDDFKSEYTGESVTGGTYEMEYIRGRGNSTWYDDKKPYKLKLNKKSDLLGMGANKHWVLLANALDDSMLRNKITYWLGDELGMPYTPQSEPVDVVMNGEYLGSYMLTEHVRIGKSRVNIDDLEDTDYTEEPEITGGYLLSRSPRHDGNEQQVFKTERKSEFLIESPEFDKNFNEAQYNYIKNYVQTLENAIYSEGFKIDGQSYRDLMDINSTVLYYWVQEFSMNWDGFNQSSVFLYKPRGDKLYWGPLWDFDFSAWGSTEFTSPRYKGWIQNGYGNWNGRLFEDPDFVADIKAAWPLVKEKIEQIIKTDGQLDLYAERLNISARYNYEKWTYNSAQQLESVTYDSEIERLRDWISGRLEWVENNLYSIEPQKTTVTFLDKNGSIVDEYEAFVGSELKFPAVPQVKGYVFEGWQYSFEIDPNEYARKMCYDTFDELKESYKTIFEPDEIEEVIADILASLKGTEIITDEGEVIKNMVLTAKYLKESEIKQVENIYFSRDKYYGINYADYADAFEIGATVTPFDATFPEIKWSSSNENVVLVTPFGWAVIMGAGDAVITATTRNGVSRSANVHIYSEQEYEELGCPRIEYGNVESNKSMTVGQYAQLKVEYVRDEGICNNSPEFTSLNPDIVELGNNGVIHALKEGTAVIICLSDAGTSQCTVTVCAKDDAEDESGDKPQGENKDNPTSPQTGNTNTLLLWIALSILSLTEMAVCIITMRKKAKQ